MVLLVPSKALFSEFANIHAIKEQVERKELALLGRKRERREEWRFPWRRENCSTEGCEERAVEESRVGQGF